MRDAGRGRACLDFEVRRPDGIIHRSYIEYRDTNGAPMCLEGFLKVNSKPGVTRPVGPSCQEAIWTECPLQNKILCQAGGLAEEIEFPSCCPLLSVTISFLQACRLKLRMPISLVQWPSLGVYMGFT